MCVLSWNLYAPVSYIVLPFTRKLSSIQVKSDAETGEPTDILAPQAQRAIEQLGSPCTKVSEIIETKDRAVFTAIQEGLDRVNRHESSKAHMVSSFLAVSSLVFESKRRNVKSHIVQGTNLGLQDLSRPAEQFVFILCVFKINQQLSYANLYYYYLYLSVSLRCLESLKVFKCSLQKGSYTVLIFKIIIIGVI